MKGERDSTQKVSFSNQDFADLPTVTKALTSKTCYAHYKVFISEVTVINFFHNSKFHMIKKLVWEQ